jgi:hypothetical protein
MNEHKDGGQNELNKIVSEVSCDLGLKGSRSK